MSTAAVITSPKPQDAETPLIQEVNLSSIKPSRANPRRRIDDAALAELAANIATHGVLQPILVRPVAGGDYQIVCGERRWRASKIADKATIPARIVNLSDAEALEFAVIENLQREDVHELDQANGFKALMQQDPNLYTVETIAAKVGRSASFVYQKCAAAHF